MDPGVPWTYDFAQCGDTLEPSLAGVNCSGNHASAINPNTCFGATGFCGPGPTNPFPRQVWWFSIGRDYGPFGVNKLITITGTYTCVTHIENPCGLTPTNYSFVILDVSLTNLSGYSGDVSKFISSPTDDPPSDSISLTGTLNAGLVSHVTLAIQARANNFPVDCNVSFDVTVT